MVIKSTKITKKSTSKVAVSKSKKTVKTNKVKAKFIRVNVNMVRSLHNKTKQFALKHNLTIHEMISAAIKEHINKQVVVETKQNTENVA